MLFTNYLNTHYDDESNEKLKDVYLNLIKRNDYSFLPTDKSEIEEMASKDFKDITERIEKMEEKFPKDGELDKYASINETILTMKLQELSSQVKRLEENQMSKWDIVVTVFYVLGGLSAIVGGVVGLIKFFMSRVILTHF